LKTNILGNLKANLELRAPNFPALSEICNAP